MSRRKWRGNKQQLMRLPHLALHGSCLVSLHFRGDILRSGTVHRCTLSLFFPRENIQQTRQTKCQDINGKKMTCKIHLTSRSLLASIPSFPSLLCLSQRVQQPTCATSAQLSSAQTAEGCTLQYSFLRDSTYISGLGCRQMFPTDATFHRHGSNLAPKCPSNIVQAQSTQVFQGN